MFVTTHFLLLFLPPSFLNINHIKFPSCLLFFPMGLFESKPSVHMSYQVHRSPRLIICKFFFLCVLIATSLLKKLEFVCRVSHNPDFVNCIQVVLMHSPVPCIFCKQVIRSKALDVGSTFWQENWRGDTLYFQPRHLKGLLMSRYLFLILGRISVARCCHSNPWLQKSLSAFLPVDFVGIHCPDPLFHWAYKEVIVSPYLLYLLGRIHLWKS